MRTRIERLIAILALVVVASLPLVRHVRAQNAQLPGTTPSQANESLYYTVPITATAAVNTATVLTIPAPPAGLFNYVCRFAYNVSQDTTGFTATNVTMSTSNFNGWATKYSGGTGASSANYDSETFNWGDPATGCAKSALAGTATVFTGPSSQTHSEWTLYATYYVGP